MTNGRSPAMAVNAYKRSVQRLVACVTDAVVDVAGGYFASPDPHRLTLSNGFPVALGGPSEFLFRLQEFYRVEEIGHPRALWNVDVVEYYYTILDSEEREVLLYHWHPRSSSSVTTPTCTSNRQHRSAALKSVTLTCRLETFLSTRFSGYS